MKTMNKKVLWAGVVGTALAMVGGNALALDQGDWFARVGGSYISPNDDSGTIEPSFGAGSGIGVDESAQLSFTVGHMVTSNIAVELLAALPFSHDIKGAGTLSGLGKIGETKHLPPTLSVQYHLAPKATVRPYVGLGLNYTLFFDEDTSGALEGVGIDLDNSFGVAGQLGVDFDINKDWFFNADVRYIQIDTEASLDTGAGDKVSVDIDPWVFTLAIGRSF